MDSGVKARGFSKLNNKIGHILLKHHVGYVLCSLENKMKLFLILRLASITFFATKMIIWTTFSFYLKIIRTILFGEKPLYINSWYSFIQWVMASFSTVLSKKQKVRNFPISRENK